VLAFSHISPLSREIALLQSPSATASGHHTLESVRLIAFEAEQLKQ
jgi:hypothetical protein